MPDKEIYVRKLRFIGVRILPYQDDELKRISKQFGQAKSELIRQAIATFINRTHERHPELTKVNHE